MDDGLSFPQALTEGYRAFLDDRFVREQDRYASLAEGQSPEILIISCCDSRVSPEVIFDARPGELFVVRNVANLVPPFETGGEYHGTSAALEFAVQALKVKHIVVLGHARCGGVRAFADDAAPLSPGDFIGRWVSLIRPAAEALGDEPAVDRRRRRGAEDQLQGIDADEAENVALVEAEGEKRDRHRDHAARSDHPEDRS